MPLSGFSPAYHRLVAHWQAAGQASFCWRGRSGPGSPSDPPALVEKPQQLSQQALELVSPAPDSSGVELLKMAVALAPARVRSLRTLARVGLAVSDKEEEVEEGEGEEWLG